MQDEKLELIVFPVNTKSEGNNFFWALSKQQLDMVLHDIDKDDDDPGFEVSTVSWQEQKMPLVSLERYFGLRVEDNLFKTKYAVVKGSLKDALESKIIRLSLQFTGNVSIRNCESSCVASSEDIIQKRKQDLHGIFTVEDGSTLIIPDVTSIWEKVSKGFYPD
ncbi:MAG: hypothetical protein OCC45_12540 [Desulfotalea sp.]